MNNVSMAGKRGAPYLAHYAASKYTVIGFSKSLALELAPFRINVNCICPGFVKTKIQKREIVWVSNIQNISKSKIKNVYINMTPIGRLVKPKDVAHIFIFIASDYSNFMTLYFAKNSNKIVNFNSNKHTIITSTVIMLYATSYDVSTILYAFRGS